MVAVRLSHSEEAAFVAAPDYLERHGVPARPEDLLHHLCIRHRQVSSGRISEWRFRGLNGEVSVEAGGTLILSDLRTVVDAARRGLGIGWSLKRGVQEDLDRGALVQVLPDFTLPRPGFFVFFPKPVQQLGMLRAFVEYFRPG